MTGCLQISAGHIVQILGDLGRRQPVAGHLDWGGGSGIVRPRLALASFRRRRVGILEERMLTRRQNICGHRSGIGAGNQMESLRQQRLQHCSLALLSRSRRQLGGDIVAVQFQPVWAAIYLVPVHPVSGADQIHHRGGSDLISAAARLRASHEQVEIIVGVGADVNVRRLESISRLTECRAEEARRIR